MSCWQQHLQVLLRKANTLTLRGLNLIILRIIGHLSSNNYRTFISKMTKSNEIFFQRLLKRITMNMTAVVTPCSSSGISDASAVNSLLRLGLRPGLRLALGLACNTWASFRVNHRQIATGCLWVC